MDKAGDLLTGGLDRVLDQDSSETLTAPRR